jgi:plasmid stabilization system protein ParE
VARLEWSAAAVRDAAELLSWLVANRSEEVAEDARAGILDTASRAARRPLLYPWVGAALPSLARADRSYRRALAWKRRIHVYFRYLNAEDRVVILHVRSARQRPISARRLTTEL